MRRRRYVVFADEPNAESSLVNLSNNIPTYLFRLYTPHTVGTTTITHISSPAWDSNEGKYHDEDEDEDGDYFEDIFQIRPQEKAARMLNDHLWWNHQHQAKCNLMSWSSSLLVVLQYGLYRHKSPKDLSELEDIYVLALDTRKFPKGTFIQDLDAIDAFHRYPTSQAGTRTLERLKNMRASEYYFGEYLSQGYLSVDGQCSQTSLMHLIDAGIFRLCPTLRREDLWKGWAKSVIAIRKEFQGVAEGTSRENVRTAITIAQACFGGRWALPLAAMLLSLRHRHYDSEEILEGFYFMFTDDEIRDLNIGEMKFDPEHERLPELKQYQEMILAVFRRHTWGSRVDGLAEELGNMKLSASTYARG